MGNTGIEGRYTEGRFREEARGILELVGRAKSLASARARLHARVSADQLEGHRGGPDIDEKSPHVVRDCARALRGMLSERADSRTGFSVIRALRDVARGRSRPDLGPGFYAEMIHIVEGLDGRAEAPSPDEYRHDPGLSGREAAWQRSDELDRLWSRVEATMARYPDGLSEESARRRESGRRRVCGALGASQEEFESWEWQIAHIAADEEALSRLASLADGERGAIRAARLGKLPFGVTPYYASLFDDDPEAGRDRARRAQVIPPVSYVERVTSGKGGGACGFDFMLERDTSPVDLVTRRYPAIAIVKPFNTCPQICVYCQRNWEIDQAMAPGALAGEDRISAAVDYVARHPAIREVLVTGGDPLGLPDDVLLGILGRVAAIPHVDVIRLGTRAPLTMPMRVTRALAEAIGRLREPGRREVCVVTHVEHVYEITPSFVRAVDLLKRQGISVLNQLVYSFFVSRRFEAAKLRLLLRRCGVDPYYTFMTKGKEETRDYRVPLARLMQEQKEEARLLPGSRRTDETVYNVPGLGKNYLRAFQHRDLLSVLPDGSRVYDFHPWEKGIAERQSYVGTDVPILDYLKRLEEIGEDPDDYASIWHYF